MPRSHYTSGKQRFKWKKKKAELREFKTNISGNFFTNSLQIVQEYFVLPHLKPFFNHTSQQITIRNE